jgi:hypothetical protein
VKGHPCWPECTWRWGLEPAVEGGISAGLGIVSAVVMPSPLFTADLWLEPAAKEGSSHVNFFNMF